MPRSRTPRPNNWMICDPSLLPMFRSPMLETRHEFQPSMKRLAPIRTFTAEPRSLMVWNSDSLVMSSAPTRPGCRRCASLRNLP